VNYSRLINCWLYSEYSVLVVEVENDTSNDYHVICDFREEVTLWLTSCKYSKRKPNLNLLFVVLQHVKKSEYTIAKRNNTFPRYSLDIYTNRPYKLIYRYVIVIYTVFIYVLFYLQ